MNNPNDKHMKFKHRRRECDNSFINYIKDTQVIITCTDKMEFKEKEQYNVFYVKGGKII